MLQIIRSTITALSLVLIFTVTAVYSQKNQSPLPGAKAVMWEPVDIKSRDLFWGPGGEAMKPDATKVTFVRNEVGGNNPKIRLKDNSDREWVVKIADESQAEIVAVRLLWGIGYKTEIDYVVSKITLDDKRTFKNVRFEARPADTDRKGRWSWTANPFLGTNELQGLKIMMALINNWDLKDENNAILQIHGQDQYIVSDLGSSFGRLPNDSSSRAGRSVNKPEHYASDKFLNGLKGSELNIAYRGAAVQLFNGITAAQGRWLADLLIQLSDKQIADAVRAANYSPEDSAVLTRAIKSRIDALDQATRMATVARGSGGS